MMRPAVCSPRERVGLLFLALTGASCSADGPETIARFVRVDSAGIEVVQNLAPRFDSGSWRLESTPVMRCSATGRDGDQRILGVMDLVPFEPNRVGILSYVLRSLLVCDDGVVDVTMGAEGEGPGEFTSVTGAVRAPGDSVAVLGPSKVVVFSRDGDGYREFPLRNMGGGVITRLVARPFGLAAVRPTNRSIDSEGEGIVDMVYLNWDGSVDATIADVPWSTSLGTLTASTLWLTDVPFELGRDDYRYASRTTFEIHRYATNGHTQIVRAPARTPVITQAMRERAVRQLVQDEGLPEMTARRLVRRDDVRGEDERAPAIVDLLLDDEDHIWASMPEVPPGEAPTVWRVVAMSGEWITDVAMPVGFRLMAVGQGHAYGVVRDELGLETVEVLALLR